MVRYILEKVNKFGGVCFNIKNVINDRSQGRYMLLPQAE